MKKYNNILVYDLETNGFFSKEGKYIINLISNNYRHINHMAY